MATEQATNSDPNARIEESLTKMFSGDEPTPPASSKPRDPESGKFVRTGAQEPAEALEPGTEPQGEAEGQEPAQDAQPQSEEVEVEIEGEKYLVPRKISDRFIQHADYTRKTQDIAELRRGLSAEREVLNIERAFAQTTAQERDHLTLLDAQIAQFKHVDWAKLETQDLLRTRAQLDQLKEARAEMAKAIEAKRAEFDNKIKSVTEEAKAAGLKYITQHIKGFDEKVQQALHEYGRAEGYTNEELSKIIDPRIVVTLWKASQWDALKASQPGITKRAANAAPVVRPGATQKAVSRVQSLNKQFAEAKTSKDKAAVAEEYFAHRLGGGR